MVEIGTNHFGEVDYLAKIARPNIGVITNIGPSHLEFFKNLKGVSREKTSLLDNLANPAIALLNADDKLLKDLIRHQIRGQRIFSYGKRGRIMDVAYKLLGCWAKARINLSCCVRR